jgi:hypothetical protein
LPDLEIVELVVGRWCMLEVRELEPQTLCGLVFRLQFFLFWKESKLTWGWIVDDELKEVGSNLHNWRYKYLDQTDVHRRLVQISSEKMFARFWHELSPPECRYPWARLRRCREDTGAIELQCRL